MDLVMNNKVVFGTSSSNRVHFERGMDRLASIEKKWPGLLGRMFTRRVDLGHVVEGLRRSRKTTSRSSWRLISLGDRCESIVGGLCRLFW